ncbi:MAG: hypothetical protein ACRCX2_38815 [Paraclostridium sp.]
MKINVEFDSIKEMDAWIARMGQPINVQQNLNVVQTSTKDPDGVEEAKEEKPKATRKRKASKPKVVKDEPKVEEKEEAPQVPANTPFIEDEKEADVPTEQEAHEQQVEPEETEEAPSQPAPTETTGTPISIKSNPELVGFLQSIFGASGNDEVKTALTAFEGGLPAYIDKSLDNYKDVTTREGALEVLKSSLGV